MFLFWKVRFKRWKRFPNNMTKVNRSHLEQILQDTNRPILVLDPQEQSKYRPESLRNLARYPIQRIISSLTGWGASDDDKKRKEELEGIERELDKSLQFEYARSIDEVYAKLEDGEYAFVLTGINAEELGVEAAQGFQTRKDFLLELARKGQPFVVNTENSAANVLRNLEKHYMCVTIDGPNYGRDTGLTFVLGSYAIGEALPVDRAQINYE